MAWAQETRVCDSSVQFSLVLFVLRLDHHPMAMKLMLCLIRHGYVFFPPSLLSSLLLSFLLLYQCKVKLRSGAVVFFSHTFLFAINKVVVYYTTCRQAYNLCFNVCVCVYVCVHMSVFRDQKHPALSSKNSISLDIANVTSWDHIKVR